MKTMTIDTTVLRGLPVTISFEVAPAEHDVGIPGPYIDDYEIVAIAGRNCKKRAEWLYKALTNKYEAERLSEKLMIAYENNN